MIRVHRIKTQKARRGLTASCVSIRNMVHDWCKSEKDSLSLGLQKARDQGVAPP